ncbi:alkyl hydroperoxide reductase subunit F [Leucothrix arctica]|uniref:Alkyl hydroperoxide reductase subunit F n=1 Tax=Leucothrix arctica TaxID=1481894 RepID=A0A317CTF5_9GAMM|nr:alkyl hydroperoxide reductase subunit F [Leucothrix arctica]PWQ99592.1 alkyl hydroperoxide reductase subunit F [Leucothrix arctica]
MLDANIKEQLKPTFSNLKSGVELVVFAGDDTKSKELLALAKDMAELSPLVSFSEGTDADERRPTLQVKAENADSSIRFSGVPMGHEFTSLILAVLHSGGHPMKVEPELIEQVRTIKGEFKFETFISLTCQNCPDVVQALNMMAVINPNISHVMIDGSVFPEEADSRKVMAVPTVFLNGEVFTQGRTSFAEIVNKIDSGASARQAESLNEKEPYEMLVVGGGPAGASAAIYSARKGIRTGIVTAKFGGQVLDTVGIENFISVKKTEGPKLVAHLEEHVKDYAVDVMRDQMASKIVAAEQVGGLISVELENGAVLKSRSIVLSTGARWREINVPGEKEYLGKGVAYCPHCDGPLFKGKRVAVVGGGNSGIEAAIDLAGLVGHVTVLEFGDTLRADAVLVRKAESLPNITIIKNAATTEITGDGDKVNAIHYTDRTNDESKTVELEGIFVQIGLIPNTEFLKDDIELSQHGEIIIDNRGATNVPGVFAAGDATTVPFKQIIIAMGAGSTAALGAFDYMIRSSAPAEEVSDAA